MNSSYSAFKVEQKDSDGKVINVYWRRYVDGKHKNAAKRLRRELREFGKKSSFIDPFGGKRRRFFRTKPNSMCPCGSKWADDDPVKVRAGKPKKYKKCCMHHGH